MIGEADTGGQGQETGIVTTGETGVGAETGMYCVYPSPVGSPVTIW